jgi:hypothetical protein
MTLALPLLDCVAQFVQACEVIQDGWNKVQQRLREFASHEGAAV